MKYKVAISILIFFNFGDKLVTVLTILTFFLVILTLFLTIQAQKKPELPAKNLIPFQK